MLQTILYPYAIPIPTSRYMFLSQPSPNLSVKLQSIKYFGRQSDAPSVDPHLSTMSRVAGDIAALMGMQMCCLFVACHKLALQ